MARRLLALCLLALLCAGSLGTGGCAYAKARGRDFSQVFRFEIGGGLAFGFDTRLGGLLDLGLGGGYTWDAMLLYGQPYAAKQGKLLAPGVCRRGIAFTTIWSHDCPSVLPPVFADEKWEQPELTHLGTLLHEFDIEVDVMAVVPHVRFGFSPGELFDAFAGVFTFDPAGDDEGAKPGPAKAAPPPSRPPAPPRDREGEPVMPAPSDDATPGRRESYGPTRTRWDPPEKAPPPPPARPAPARPAPAPEPTDEELPDLKPLPKR